MIVVDISLLLYHKKLKKEKTTEALIFKKINT
jgi:hypothetical protein